MKRKFVVFSFFIILVTLLSGCGKDNENSFRDRNESSKDIIKSSQSTESTQGTVSTTIKSENKEEDLKTKDNDSKISEKKSESKKTNKNIKRSAKDKENDIEEFYGKWTVKKVESYGKDTLKNNSNDILGKTIEFSKDKIVFDGKEYDKPYYTAIEKDESNSSKELRVGNSKDIGIGNSYIKKDSDTLIMIKNGDYYELKKY